MNTLRDGCMAIVAGDNTTQLDLRTRIMSLVERGQRRLLASEKLAVAEKSERLVETDKGKELLDSTAKLIEDKGEIGRVAFDEIASAMSTGRIAETREVIDQINQRLKESGSPMKVEMSVMSSVTTGFYGGTNQTLRLVALLNQEEDSVVNSWKVSESKTYKGRTGDNPVTRLIYFGYDRQGRAASQTSQLLKLRNDRTAVGVNGVPDARKAILAAQLQHG